MRIRATLAAVLALTVMGCTGQASSPVSNPPQPISTTETIELAESESVSSVSETTSSSTPTPTLVPREPPGAKWTTHDVKYRTREGATSAAGGGWFFTWGGFPDRSPGEPVDGLLFNVELQQFFDVPAAPITARYLSSTIWTGNEFIVFGGYSKSEAFADGAAFDPTTKTWRPIAPSPFEPSRLASTVWAGSHVFVWTAANDTPVSQWFGNSPGQFASYEPVSDVWELLPSPDISVIDVALFQTGESITLVGGPPMRDTGGAGTGPRIQFTEFDLEAHSWTEPRNGPTTGESVRPFVFGNGGLAILSSSGLVQSLTPTKPPVLDLGEGCWWDVAAVSDGQHAYLKTCESVWVADAATGTHEQILSPGQDGATNNTFGSAFVSDETGRLFTFGDPESSRDVPPGVSILAVHEP